MSLIMPICINSTTIGCLTIRRLDKLTDTRNVYEYEWELAMNDKKDLRGRQHGQSASGLVHHDYGDGAVQLIKKVMETL